MSNHVRQRVSIVQAISLRAQGRGFLVVDWLAGGLTAEEYLAGLAGEEKSYNPFNLVLLERDSAGLYSVSTALFPGKVQLLCCGVSSLYSVL